MRTDLKRSNTIYFIYLLLAAVFLILKMKRGFSGSGEAGGIWNIIQLLFIVSGIVVLFSKEKSFNSFRCVSFYLYFFLYIWLLSLFPFLFSNMTTSQLFGFATVPYGVMVLIVYYAVGSKVDIKQYRWILLGTFYVISVILFLAMRNFRMRIGDQGALADVYYVVTLLPMALLYAPKKLKLIPFMIAFIVVAMTGKRGAFIAMGMIMVIYFMLPFSTNDDNIHRTSNKTVRLIAFALLLILVWYVINSVVAQFNLNIIDRLNKMDEDGGSGRMSRWGGLLGRMSNETNAIQLFMGHGSGSVYKTIGGHAHNDFLEFLYDYGVFAVILYVSFFVSVIKEGIRMYKHRYPYVREFLSTICIALCMAMLSFYAIDCTHITASSICFGLILSDWKKYKNNGYRQIKQD